MMNEQELPTNIQYLLIALQLVALAVFLYFIWPYVKAEPWKKKFIENKQAFSIIIVMLMIFGFLYGLGAFFDAFFPVERLDVAPAASTP